eukprot:CAMPEP_0179443492 /NCGR_PEP_ID=MMETSP0799-20121207/26930_1 /TAXON_ID=46947 /ORGANISM="Geminigera cryophila, Strain CCMP2564" /LENGTH=68 /DNA_ID=CAMNT_0021229573 /DNA_START=14 /DNA_END=220 /DNA_ORIENTATION=-
MALSHAFAKLGPMPVQVIVGVLGCMGGSYTMMTGLKKDNNLRTNTPEWRAKNPNNPNPLRDPEGKMNK